MKAAAKNRARSFPTAATAETPSFRRDIILLAVCTLLLCSIYMGKAYNMDDPLVLWTAQRIAANPADFYGFEVNWWGYYTPMLQTDLNPPGAAYYAAVWGALFGFREAAIHGGVALVAVALILGIYQLARQMGGSPMPAAAIALASPGVFVSMGTVMTDLPMTAAWVWAVLLWLRGLEKTHPGLNAASGLLIGLAAMSKYFALSLIPLLLVHTLFHGKNRRTRLVWLLIPVGILGLFEVYTERLYGVGQIRQIYGMIQEYHQITSINLGRKLLTELTFLGAGAAPVLFLAPWLWRRRERAWLWVAAALVALATITLRQSGWRVAEPEGSLQWWFWIQYGLWLLAGIHIVALMGADIWTRRDRNSLLLGLWLGGTLFYCVFVYHFVNIRVLLPALPAVVLVCARRLQFLHADKKNGLAPLPRPVWAAIAASLALSITVACADISLANSARTAAERIAPKKRSGTTWFSGHWGFQYYMEASGAKPIDMNHQDFRLGDTFVTPMNGTNRFLTRARIPTTDQSFEAPVFRWATTMRAECGAGFYSDLWGPLPFVFGPVPAERYQVTVLGSGTGSQAGSQAGR